MSDDYVIHNDIKEKTTIIITFDKNDICIGARYCIEGIPEKDLQKKYDLYNSKEYQEIPTISNVDIKNGNLIYTNNQWIHFKYSKKQIEDLLNTWENWTILEI